MRTLFEKIKADAEARLVIAPGVPPAHELELFRRYLKRENHRLKMHHRAGGGGREVCQARALVLDLLLTKLLVAVEYAAPASRLASSPRRALVAVGGYGRGELNPFSDVDILLLHEAKGFTRSQPPPFLDLLTSGLLWDIGLKVGHSVRTIDVCVEEANKDMQSKTALIEARRITGDEALFDQMRAAILARCVKGHENDYMTARLADQAVRRAKFGNSACMQEPNIKNGCGGLRDYQNLLWMAFFKYRGRTTGELVAQELITAREAGGLEEAYDFLLRVRNELHYHVNRPVDVLTRSVQPGVAHNLGYTDRSLSRRLEAFMRDYYVHSRNLYLSTRTLEQRLALLPQPKRLPTLRQFLRRRRELAGYVLDGFKFVDGQIHAASNRIFSDQPRRLMRAFRYAQQRGLTLHPGLAQLIRSQLGLVGPQFRRDPHVHETFVGILNERGSVAPAVRAMHEVGLLGRYLPSFGKLTCLVQHEFYHQFTTDEHTLVCLEKLDQLSGAQKPPLSAYAELLQKVERPYVLYLALLLHDAGKAASTRNHADSGSRIALAVGKRLGLDAATNHTLSLLVASHLEMAMVSQRRDLEDPAVISAFAAQIENQENLNLLTLLTLADSTATSDKLWNGFKDTSLWTLHHKTRALLAGVTEFIQLESKQRDSLAAEVRALMPATFQEDELQAHFGCLPARYFQLRAAKEVLADLTLVHCFMQRQLSEEEPPLKPITAWHHERDRGYSLVRVCTWDRHGLFTTIAGALTAAGLNILSAEIFTREDWIVLDTFYVADATTGGLANREEVERFERILHEALAGEADLGELIRRRKPAQPLYAPHAGERLPTVIRFENPSSDTRTVLDLETEDRVGLLYSVSQALSGLNLDISLARICTERGAAMDSFYLSEAGGGQVVDGARQEKVRAALRAAIQKLD